ncbi:cytochrome c3 family protein [Geomonas sp. Red69]|uniref:cytochrome c3 family protein n=1 Tax=Geomonas diazotrophica TaxID=2843197 RepID=UPI001C112188|nr:MULTISPECIES: cytochrome c3 family protein [Geomonas]MBU5637932.1 cytochrome c3 family protein [Geomonas diazotrophica]QXE85599.1 cytochrome c3 family protein [Geomonas nitrogeniifigens]
MPQKIATSVLLLGIVTYLLVPLSVTTAGAGEAAQKEACVTSSCHANMGKAAFVHGPAAVGECTGCHTKIGKHKFEPIINPGQQCLECHEKLNTMTVVHAPVRMLECVKCHDPHQSPYKYQLRAEGSNLCFLCHSKAIVSGKYLHGPLGVGGCNACHYAHQSPNRKLLIAEGNSLCFTCHTDKAEAFKDKKYMHAPVKEACINCHSPHSSDYRFTLSANGNMDLCYKCHRDKEKAIASATVPHKGVQTDRKCLACHDPHVSDFPKQLVRQPMDLCMSCHDREYNGANGKIANMSVLLGNGSEKHGPIQEKDCSGCHDAHGSNNFRILLESFPQLFYAPYNADNYKLCFMCHQKTIASVETTTTLTGFRNGDQNLHFVHVNKAVKGRTCRACHDAHATNNPKHVRDGVPFAKWQLPIGFKKSANGGACLPGCHQLFSYDRVKPVLNKQVQGK